MLAAFMIWLTGHFVFRIRPSRTCARPISHDFTRGLTGRTVSGLDTATWQQLACGV